LLVEADELSRQSLGLGAVKFSAIIRKVTEFLSLDQNAKLKFEVSDGVKPMALYRAALPTVITHRRQSIDGSALNLHLGF